MMPSETKSLRTFVIPGDPIPLARPRYSNHNSRVYDSQKQEKLIIGITLRNQYEGEPMKGPLHLTARFYLPMPKTRTTKPGAPHYFRPDLSNLLKWVEDVITDIIITDDALIASIFSSKMYDLNPRTEFTLMLL